MKRVKCKSGLKGYQCRLRTNYKNFEEFEAYDEVYTLANRLGFATAEQAWEKNPTIQGSTEPTDFRVVKDNSWRKIGKHEYKLHAERGTMLEARADKKELQDNHSVKFISRGKYTTGCFVYKRKLKK